MPPCENVLGRQELGSLQAVLVAGGTKGPCFLELYKKKQRPSMETREGKKEEKTQKRKHTFFTSPQMLYTQSSTSSQKGSCLDQIVKICTGKVSVFGYLI